VCKNFKKGKDVRFLMHLNIQGGIVNKIHDLYIFLLSFNVDVLCLNEHWLLETQLCNFSILNNYKLGAFYCRNESSRGGTCILIKDNYDFKERIDFYLYNEEGIFEMCCIEIPALNSIVISMYRTPYDTNFKNFINKFESLLLLLQKYQKKFNIYIAADFNIDILENTSSPGQKNVFLNLISMYGFQTNFCSPTRVTKNTLSSIDNILTNCIFKSSNLKQKMNVDLGISDHRALCIALSPKSNSTSPNKRTCFKKRLFTNSNLNVFCKNISETIWDLSSTKNAQSNFNSFFQSFMSNFNYCFPLKFYSCKLSKNKSNKNWVTKGITISSRRKRELSKMAKVNDDANFQNYYKKYRKIFKTVCDKARKLSNCDMISKADNRSKAVWTVVKSELGTLGCKSRDFPDLCVSGNFLKDGNEIADFLNNKFAHISQEKGCQPNFLSAAEYTTNFNIKKKFNFQFVHTSVPEVKKVIMSLKNKTSVGWDEVPIKLIKLTVDSISYPLCKIINQCFDEGIFPNQFKYAEIKPLFKKGCVEDPSNYRSVALLPAMSKIFEKIAFNQIYSYFENNNLFSDNQFGFRSGRSTISAVADFINQVSNGLDSSQSTAGVFCDLSNAFDCVNYNILISKLQHYKFSKLAMSWVNSYLSNRQQRTIILKNNSKFISEWQNIECGVPQGSILGPLLFLIYVNDIPKNSTPSLILYADDTTAVVKASDIVSLKNEFQISFQELSKWFNANGLKLNSLKTQIIKFQTVQDKKTFDLDLYHDSNILSFVDNTKFLGINIDKNLTWTPHIEITIKKLNVACFQMYVLRNVIDIKTKLTVYYAIFYSIMQYGIELWGSASCAHKVFKIQKKYLRIMTFNLKRTSCKPLFEKYSLLTMPCLFIFKILLLLKNNFNSFYINQYNHKYPTRFKKDFQYPRHRLLLFEKSPYYMGLKLYNRLPAYLKEINDYVKFKNSLKMYLLSKTYYSLEEYLSDSHSTIL
jgi:hypothetical protein